MNISQFFKILRARFWVFFLALTVTVLTTVGVSLYIPKTYQAEAIVIIDFKGSDLFGGSNLPIQMSSSYMATQIDVLRSKRVALSVVDTLRLDQNATAQQQYQEATQGQGNIRSWLAEALVKNLDIEPARDSRLVKIVFSSTDPRFAATVANAFAQAYSETNLDLSLDPAKRNAEWFDAKIKQMRDSVTQLQTKLTGYQQKHGIVATDERLDMENTRLTTLARELVIAQAATQAANARLTQTQRLLKAGGEAAQSIPEVLSNQFIQSLKAEILRNQAKLDELSRDVGANHPHYLSAKAEITSLRKKLRSEVKLVAKGIENNTRLAREREQILTKTLAAQKKKVLELKLERDEISVLSREIGTARLVYETALQRANQMSLESQFNFTNVTILTPAVEPTEHAKPKVMLNVILSVFLGSLLGLGFVLLIEMLDRKVRSEQDLVDVFDVPMFAETGRSYF